MFSIFLDRNQGACGVSTFFTISPCFIRWEMHSGASLVWVWVNDLRFIPIGIDQMRCEVEDSFARLVVYVAVYSVRKFLRYYSWIFRTENIPAPIAMLP